MTARKHIHWTRVVRDSPAGDGVHQRALLLILAARADRDGRAWPSMSQLATDTGMSIRSVATHLAALADAGIIRHTGNRPSRSGGRPVKEWTLQLDVLAGLPQHEPAAGWEGPQPAGAAGPNLQEMQSQPAGAAGRSNQGRGKDEDSGTALQNLQVVGDPDETGPPTLPHRKPTPIRQLHTVTKRRRA